MQTSLEILLLKQRVEQLEKILYDLFNDDYMSGSGLKGVLWAKEMTEQKESGDKYDG